MNDEAAVEITALAAGAGPPENNIATFLMEDLAPVEADISQQLRKSVEENFVIKPSRGGIVVACWEASKAPP